ncbi:hypothetical protein AALM99_03890 [Lactococcus muris]|uniref:Uncharacterized protein n=1 Tax=Lactococcus muris TaxID=2941330 RepID=A0ABV4D775_9LACT|nr:hypothetical protein [Lactococcus garvieae]
MLTDRQNKFLLKISKLSEDTMEISKKERKYLLRCKKNILSANMKFSDCINSLNLSLSALDKLTPKVQKLSEELIEVYGRPDYRELSNIGKKVSYKLIGFR